MDYTNNYELTVFRATIAVKQIPQKLLAYRFNISGSLLSQYLNGTLRMPEAIRKRLIVELDLESAMERLMKNSNA